MSLLAAIPHDLFTFGPFEIWGPIKIHSFGLFVAIGLMITFSLSARKGEQKLGIDGEKVQNFGIYLIVIGWIFAHIFNVIFYEPHLLKEDPLILFKVWGSISSYGGLFGGIIAAWIWRIRNPNEDFIMWCDLAAWGLTYSWLFGRIGCASVHDHPGAETDFVLAISGWPGDGTTRHDLGFYEAMWWVVICTLMLVLDRKPRPKGFYLALVPTLYAPARFTLDFLRVGPEQGGDVRYFGLTPAQYFSIGIFIVGLYFWNRVRQSEPLEWKKYVPPEEAPDAPDASDDDSDEDDEQDAKPASHKSAHRRKKKKK